MPRRELLVSIGLTVIACRAPAATITAPPTVAPAPAPARPFDRAAFVIYGAGAQGQASTWIVPYTLSATPVVDPALQLDGWWVQEDEPAGVTTWHRGHEADPGPLSQAIATRLWDARCPVGAAVEGACTWPPEQVVTRFTADGAMREQLVDDHTCACFDLPVADRTVLLANDYQKYDDPEADPDDADEDEETCEMAFHFADTTDAALLGGVMQSFTHHNDLDCLGSRSVDITTRQTSLTTRTAPPRADLTGAAGFRVTSEDAETLAWALPPRFEDEAEDPDPTGEEDDDEVDCDIDGELWSVQRGHLVRTQLGAHALGTCVWHTWRPVSPALCPSLADPCGRAEVFPALVDAPAPFWIASDERSALMLGDRPAIVGAGGRLRVSIDLTGLDSARIVGVRHHRWADPIIRASAAETDDPALDWLPVALRWPAAVTRPMPALAPTDRDRGDRRGGRDWGNRCFAHFKAGRLDAAEAACARGLDIASDAAIRGAIFHSLGRLSEARGHDSAAIVFYRTSLVLRPDDATRRRFTRLLAASP